MRPCRTRDAISIVFKVIAPDQHAVLRRVLIMAGIVTALLLIPPAVAPAESNPFFPSSSPSAKRTTGRTSGAKALNGTHTIPASKFTIPASARLKPSSGTSTPATSTTIYRPASETSSTQRAVSPSTRSPLGSLGSLRTATSPRAHTGASSTSNSAIIAAILAALALLVSLAWGVSRLLVYEPTWVLTLRHSLEEASFRVSATVSEFADWVRLGR